MQKCTTSTWCFGCEVHGKSKFFSKKDANGSETMQPPAGLSPLFRSPSLPLLIMIEVIGHSYTLFFPLKPIKFLCGSFVLFVCDAFFSIV